MLPEGNGSVAPLGMSNRAVGGGTNTGQVGITGISGLNNIGLLVKVWGQVSAIDSSDFGISDGAGRTITVTVPTGVSVPAADTYVAVTGISDCQGTTGTDRQRHLCQNGGRYPNIRSISRNRPIDFRTDRIRGVQEPQQVARAVLVPL